MPTHLPSAFTAAVAVARTHPGEEGQPAATRLHLLPEMNVTTPSIGGNETSAYVLARPKQPFRLFFERDIKLKPLTELECYVCLLYVDGKTPWTKVYGAGEGVEPPITSPWYLDGEFGDHPEKGLAGTVEQKVVLLIHKCVMREGTKLGSGHLLASGVAGMEEGATAKFQWQYLTSPEHVSALGLTPSQAPDGGASPASIETAQLPGMSREVSPRGVNPGLEGAEDPANAFLRRANSLLLSLLTPTQRLEFLTNLTESTSLAIYLSDASRSELDAMIHSLSVEALGGVQVEKATKPISRRADSAPLTRGTGCGVENHGAVARVSVAALVGSRRSSPLAVEAVSDSATLHLRPLPIRSPSRPSSVRLTSPRKRPLSDSYAQVDGEEGGAMGTKAEQMSEVEASGPKKG